MREWAEIVRTRIGAIGLAAEREDEIQTELAGHLEDACVEALQRGLTEDDAVAHALEQVPDWTQLAQAIRRADQKEGPMSRDTKTVWLPGMTALAGAAAVLFATQLVPASLWTDPRSSVRLLMMGLALACYLACGAIGASWSRRAGGSLTARLLAGIFPLALHVAIVITTMVFGVNFQLGRVALAFIMIPGMALTVGALPFLRDSSVRQTA